MNNTSLAVEELRSDNFTGCDIWYAKNEIEKNEKDTIIFLQHKPLFTHMINYYQYLSLANL